MDIVGRLWLAVMLGGLVGVERQLHGRWADVRTHMIVSLAAAMFVVSGTALAPGSPEITRVLQGVAAGVGFLGAGTILKLSDQVEVKGLTTASSIWLSAAVGTAAGAEQYTLAVAGTGISLAVLILLRPLEKWFEQRG